MVLNKFYMLRTSKQCNVQPNPKATKQIESSVCSQNAPLSFSLKENEIGSIRACYKVKYYYILLNFITLFSLVKVQNIAEMAQKIH
jgi:hypothetical protein